MSYITSADIKADLVRNLDIEPYIEEADFEINDLAELKGVYETTDIKTDPLHYKIKRYAIVFVLMRICQDSLGTNSVDTDREKYKDNLEMYQKELDQLKPLITYEMLTGNVQSMIGRTAVFNLYRS